MRETSSDFLGIYFTSSPLIDNKCGGLQDGGSVSLSYKRRDAAERGDADATRLSQAQSPLWHQALEKIPRGVARDRGSIIGLESS